MKKFLSNSFSLQMLQMLSNAKQEVVITPLTLIQAREELATSLKSCIGHQDTANVVGGLLGRIVPCNRESITLSPEDTLYVAQVIGGRLPEGTTVLPSGIEIQFLKVELRGNWKKRFYDFDGGDIDTITIENCTWAETFNKGINKQYEGFNLSMEK